MDVLCRAVVDLYFVADLLEPFLYLHENLIRQCGRDFYSFDDTVTLKDAVTLKVPRVADSGELM